MLVRPPTKRDLRVDTVPRETFALTVKFSCADRGVSVFWQILALTMSTPGPFRSSGKVELSKLYRDPGADPDDQRQYAVFGNLWLDAAHLKVRERGRIVGVAVNTEVERQISVSLHILPAEAALAVRSASARQQRCAIGRPDPCPKLCQVERHDRFTGARSALNAVRPALLNPLPEPRNSEQRRSSLRRSAR